MLPSGVGRLSAACAAFGWVLALDGNRVYAWSAASGWATVPTPRLRDLEILGPVEAGVLVLARAGAGSHEPREMLGLWPFGARDWAFWTQVPHRRLQLLDGSLLFDREDTDAFLGTSPSLLRVRAVTAAGLEVRHEADVAAVAEAEHLLGASRMSDGSVRFATSLRLMAMDGAATRELGRLDQGLDCTLLGPSFSSESVLVMGRGATRAPAVIDLAQGRTRIARFAFPDVALRHLWRAYLRNDRGFVRRALDGLARIPQGDESTYLHDLLVADGEVTAVVGPGGVCQVQPHAEGPAPPLEQAASIPAWNEVLLHGLDAASWRLWMDPDAHLDAAIGELLDGPILAEEVLIRGLAEAAGERVPALALEVARSRSLPTWEGSARELFAFYGPSVSDLLLEALTDPHRWVSLAAIQGLSAPAVAAPLLKGGRRSLLEARLREKLQSDEPEHRSAALRALGRLGWRGVNRDVVAGLRDEDESVREAAASAAGALRNGEPELRAEVCRAASRDVEKSVRRKAVEALGAIGGAEAHATLVSACSDPDTLVRFKALNAVESLTARFGLPLLWDTLDRTLLLLIAAQEARRTGADPTDFGMGIDDVHTALASGLVHRLLENDDVNDLSALAAVPPERRARLGPLFVFGLALGLLFPEVDDGMSKPDAVESATEQLGLLSRPPVLSREEIERLVAHRPPALLAQLAERFRRQDPRVSRRMAVLAVLASRSVEGGVGDLPGDSTLASRLRGLSAPSPLARSAKRVRELSAEDSPLGLVAAFALATRGDRAARQRFETRALGLDLETCPAFAVFCALHLGRSESVAFAARLATCQGLPPQTRLRALEGVSSLWERRMPDAVPPDALRALHVACVRSAATPFGSRLRLARDLLDRGTVAPLEALWLEREAAGRVRTTELYECDRDLALCGRAERMDRVRAEWRARGDGLAIKALELHGEPRDVRALLAACSEDWNPEWLRRALEAILARHAAGASTDGE